MNFFIHNSPIRSFLTKRLKSLPPTYALDSISSYPSKKDIEFNFSKFYSYPLDLFINFTGPPARISSHLLYFGKSEKGDRLVVSVAIETRYSNSCNLKSD